MVNVCAYGARTPERVTEHDRTSDPMDPTLSHHTSIKFKFKFNFKFKLASTNITHLPREVDALLPSLA